MRTIGIFSAAALLATTGCSHRGVLHYPGPTYGMGFEPVSYAESIGVVEDPVVDTPVVEEPTITRTRTTSRSGGRHANAVGASAGKLIQRSKLVVGGQKFRFDCSGMVMAAYAGAGQQLSGSSQQLYDLADRNGLLHKKKRPSSGDVVFFDNTYDRNRNGRRDDKLTHVAVVESVDEAGTVSMVHLGSKGVVRIYMNLHHPDQSRGAEGERLNSYLRASSTKDKGPVLAGQLWRSFGSLWALDEGQLSALGCTPISATG